MVTHFLMDLEDFKLWGKEWMIMNFGKIILDFWKNNLEIEWAIIEWADFGNQTWCNIFHINIVYFSNCCFAIFSLYHLIMWFELWFLHNKGNTFLKYTSDTQMILITECKNTVRPRPHIPSIPDMGPNE